MYFSKWICLTGNMDLQCSLSLIKSWLSMWSAVVLPSEQPPWILGAAAMCSQVQWLPMLIGWALWMGVVVVYSFSSFRHMDVFRALVVIANWALSPCVQGTTCSWVKSQQTQKPSIGSHPQVPQDLFPTVSCRWCGWRVLWGRQNVGCAQQCYLSLTASDWRWILYWTWKKQSL